MSQAQRALDPADEALLAALAGRLGRVDDELARSSVRAAVRADAPPLHVVRGRTMPRGARAVAIGGSLDGARARGHRASDRTVLALAIAVVVVIAAARSLGSIQPSALPAGAASPTASSGVAASGRAAGSSASIVASSDRPSTVPAPSSDVPGEPPMDPPIDPDLGALRTAMAIVSWPCAVTIRVAHDPIAPGLVAKLERTRRLPDGFVPGGLDPIWSGSDADAAARAFKGRRVATSSTGDAWILRQDASGPALLELVVQRTPLGSSLWRTGDVAWPISCSRTADDPKALLVGHAGSDWPSGQVIDIAAVQLGVPGRLPGVPR